MITNLKKGINLTLVLLPLLAVIAGSFSSCVSPKSIVYFQGDTLKYHADTITQIYVPTIEPNDILTIIVGSLSPESNEMFNAAAIMTTASTNYATSGAGAKLQPLGYLVQNDGTIEMPLIGKISLQGLKTEQASELIRTRLKEYLKEPSVIVRNVNFKVSILGEVKAPAIYVVPDEKITLPQVLSLAGDMTIYGNRKNVLVIREENGKREYARIDLTSREVFNSPYYYLHKNDVVYVEPVEAKMLESDIRARRLPLIASVISAVSTLTILVLNFVK
ncbi:polysaccharide biosynthesis/export family protein [Dyadobacter tibetensis]|uniref:polysaccharide biosynthesis/export family protein n=1 Tax=Dyadobacter tibetensis TaxID=1211851 RepID=UPI000471AA37|nr:polysaccharide biosynthesis/export family protein [Dyadobacter tibetensis]